MDPSPHTARSPEPRVTLTRYLCPWCRGHGDAGDRCMHCAGSGTTDDPTPGVDLHTTYPDGVAPPVVPAEPLPRPPAVMPSPCVDCAYRPGAPEEDYRPDASSPFWCHHGMARVDGPGGAEYRATAWLGQTPLGYMVCAGWWAQLVDEPAPTAPYRDPKGRR